MHDDSRGRVVAAIKKWLATAPAGARLPSSRTLVGQLGVGPVTVQRAMALLVAEGLVETRPGVGAFARSLPLAVAGDFGWQTGALGAASVGDRRTSSLRAAGGQAVALHSGYPDRELLPERLLRAALTRAARNDAAVHRPPPAGLPELQAWFAAELADQTPSHLPPASPAEVMVFPGSQSGLSAVFRGLVGVGGTMLIESPTYWGAISAARQAGIRLVPVPSGPEGIDADELERALRRTGARMIYAQPRFANPTGALWSTELSERVLELLRRQGAFLIEDDWARDFQIAGPAGPQPMIPLAARDTDGHVLHLRSLTKSISPAIRVAAVIARGPVRERVLAIAGAESMYVSGVLQAVAHDVVTQPGWRTHLRGLGRQLGVRRDAMIAAVTERLPTAQIQGRPAGGLNLWVRLPDRTDVPGLVRDCEASGVLVGPGDEWFPAEPTGAFLRLNYSGPDPTNWSTGLEVVARCLARQSGLH